MSLALKVEEGIAVFASYRVDASPRSKNLWFRRNQLAALALLVGFGPFLAIVAACLWCSDGAPIIFAHYRVGRGGQLFRCFKFRTMRRDSERLLAELLATDANARAEWERDHKLVDDPRVTAIGRFLRKTSLDELPQLFNVLRGDMALVGPRPITVAELLKYGEARWHYLCVLPGMTGLWQVSGRSNLSYEQRVALDRQYVIERSMVHDVGILFRTLSVVVGRGAR